MISYRCYHITISLEFERNSKPIRIQVILIITKFIVLGIDTCTHQVKYFIEPLQNRFAFSCSWTDSYWKKKNNLVIHILFFTPISIFILGFSGLGWDRDIFIELLKMNKRNEVLNHATPFLANQPFPERSYLFLEL